jgi:hypothetical protein
MAVALDVAGAGQSQHVVSSPVTFVSPLTTSGSLANGAIVVGIVFGVKTVPALVTSVTWGGTQTMTAIPSSTQLSSGANGATVFYGLVGVNKFGAQNIVITFTGGSATDITLVACSWTGVDQTTSFAGSATGATSTAPAITVTSLTGNAVMAIFADLTVGFTSTNNTNLFLDNSQTQFNAAGLRAAGASSVSCTTNTITSEAWIASGVNIIAVGAGAAPFFQTDWPVPGRTTYDPRVQQQLNIVNQQTNQQTTQGPVTGSQCM